MPIKQKDYGMVTSIRVDRKDLVELKRAAKAERRTVSSYLIVAAVEKMARDKALAS